jgi:hypothetical protein
VGEYRIARPARFGEEACLEAMAEEEARLGRPMSQREREGFARGFHSTEYREELRRLMVLGVRDES